jgi:hypothetical protein
VVVLVFDEALRILGDGVARNGDREGGQSRRECKDVSEAHVECLGAEYVPG